MADFLIRGLDEHTMKRLKERAEKNGRSLQAEIKDTLKRSVKMTKDESLAMSRRLLDETKHLSLSDSTPWIREDRDR